MSKKYALNKLLIELKFSPIETMFPRYRELIVATFRQNRTQLRVGMENKNFYSFRQFSLYHQYLIHQTQEFFQNVFISLELIIYNADSIINS